MQFDLNFKTPVRITGIQIFVFKQYFLEYVLIQYIYTLIWMCRNYHYDEEEEEEE